MNCIGIFQCLSTYVFFICMRTNHRQNFNEPFLERGMAWLQDAEHMEVIELLIYTEKAGQRKKKCPKTQK